jgi:hypothetical protein
MTVQEQYDEATTQYHRLMTGTAAVSVADQNGEKVEYNRANRASLKAYIDELASLLGQAGSVNRQPLRVYL